MADRFASQGYTRWSNDKTITELSYRKISWFVTFYPVYTDPPPFRKNWRRSTRLRFTVITESCMGIILHKINKKQFLPTKNSVAHVSCHSSSQNVGAHRQLIFIEQLRERERFLKLVYSIPSKKNVLASPYYWRKRSLILCKPSHWIRKVISLK